jgi:SAM-dependent methyltransferase
LPDVGRCDHCASTFDADGGTPRLIGSARRTVRFDYAAEDYATAAEELRTVLRDPPAPPLVRSSGGGEAGVPYHLDLAHAEVFRRLAASARDGGRRRRVLEIGCGGGQARPWLTRVGFDYVGVDISKTRVFDWLQEFGGPDLLCDAHALPFGPGQFDVVYCAAVTEHLACPPLVFQQCWRVLRAGGTFLGNVSFLEPWHDNSYFHMTPLGVLQTLRAAGFRADAIWPGRGYSGFHSLMRMGNRATQWFPFAGAALYRLYRAGGQLRNGIGRARGRGAANADILDRAKVAGAIDWIATRPLS